MHIFYNRKNSLPVSYSLKTPFIFWERFHRDLRNEIKTERKNLQWTAIFNFFQETNIEQANKPNPNEISQTLVNILYQVTLTN